MIDEIAGVAKCAAGLILRGRQIKGSGTFAQTQI
jgi:hypothetical protein